MLSNLINFLASLIYGKKYVREMNFLNTQHALLKAGREDEAVTLGREYVRKYGTF